jgi:small ligand-binding sensory domain FIST
MRWVSAISEAEEFEDAVYAVGDTLAAGLDGAAPALVAVFVSAHHAQAYPRVGRRLADRFPGAHVFGASVRGAAGNGREVEGTPVIAAVAASLPNVELVPFHLDLGEIPDPENPAEFHQRLGIGPDHAPAFLLLPDPFTCDVDRLVRALDAAWPGSVKLGGLASAARRAGGNGLFSGRDVHNRGVVGLALYGDIAVDPVVAQGARPVGEPLVVSGCTGTLVTELDGMPVLDVLEETFGSFSSDDRALFRRAPIVGVAVESARARPRAGDWLVRDVVGVDRAAGVLGVAWPLVAGDVVQFHVRDAASATAELTELLGRAVRGRAPPAAALMFSCAARGADFYGAPDHDSRVFAETVGHVPLGGSFCSGEIGPLRGRTFLHGFTSVLALVRSRGWN